MERYLFISLSLCVSLLSFETEAQGYYVSNLTADSSPVKKTYLLPGVYPAVVIEGDTIPCIWLPEFIKYSPLVFRTSKDQAAYSRLVRDVKKTLPYAKEISSIIKETYEYMETLPDEKAKQKHLNRMEKYLKELYTPKMSKLTRSQGQLLIKLVDRETNSSSYRIVDAFMGSFKAWSYNVFAGLFGNSLKVRYNPFGEDRLTERVCVLVEQGVV